MQLNSERQGRVLQWEWKGQCCGLSYLLLPPCLTTTSLLFSSYSDTCFLFPSSVSLTFPLTLSFFYSLYLKHTVLLFLSPDPFSSSSLVSHCIPLVKTWWMQQRFFCCEYELDMRGRETRDDVDAWKLYRWNANYVSWISVHILICISKKKKMEKLKSHKLEKEKKNIECFHNHQLWNKHTHKHTQRVKLEMVVPPCRLLLYLMPEEP